MICTSHIKKSCRKLRCQKFQIETHFIQDQPAAAGPYPRNVFGSVDQPGRVSGWSTNLRPYLPTSPKFPTQKQVVLQIVLTFNTKTRTETLNQTHRDAQGSPTQSRISPIILLYVDERRLRNEWRPNRSAFFFFFITCPAIPSPQPESRSW
jgi:hypothetical protein